MEIIELRLWVPLAAQCDSEVAIAPVFCFDGLVGC